MTPSELLSSLKCLHLQPGGSQCLLLHNAVFTSIFIGGPSRRPPCQYMSVLGLNTVTKDQYFGLLCCEELRWRSFFEKMVPFLPAKQLASVVSSLIVFILKNPLDRSGDQQAKLLSSCIAVILSAVLNIIPSTKQLQTCASQNVEQNADLTVEHSNIEGLIDKLLQCLNYLLPLLADTAVLNGLRLEDIRTIIYNLHIVCTLANTLVPTQQTISILFGNNVWNKMEQNQSDLCKNENHRENKDKSTTIDRRNNITSTKRKSDEAKACFADDDFKMTMLSPQFVKKTCLNSPDEGSKEMETKFVSAKEDNECEITGSLNNGPEMSDSDTNLILKKTMCERNNKLFVIFLSVFRRKITSGCFLDLVKFLACGEIYQVKPVLDILKSDLFEKKCFKVGRHTFDSVYLVNSFRELFTLTDCSESVKLLSLKETLTTSPAEFVEDSVYDNISEMLMKLASVDWFFKQTEFFGSTYIGPETELHRMVALGGKYKTMMSEGLNHLGGHDLQVDLDLLNLAVETKHAGWIDLLSAGMCNPNIERWWKKGFLELVETNMSVLCTVDNIRQLVLTLEGKTKTDFDAKRRKLFQSMFRKLPLPLQENVVRVVVGKVLSRCDSEAGVSYWSMVDEIKTLTEPEVDIEMTSLLNRLTLQNAHLKVTDMLLLCLESPTTVIKHLLLRAVDSNGQMAAIAQVLQSMSSVLSLYTPGDAQGSCDTYLCQGLESVITEGEIREDKWRNVQQLFLHLAKTFSLPKTPALGEDTMKMQTVLSADKIIWDFVAPLWEEWVQSEHEKNSQGDEDNVSASGDSSDVTRPDTAPRTVSRSQVAMLLSVANILLPEMTKRELKRCHPYSLAIVLGYMYCVSWEVTKNGELDRQKVQIKGGVIKCLGLLCGRVNHHFTKEESKKGREWVFNKSLKDAASLAHPSMLASLFTMDSLGNLMKMLRKMLVDNPNHDQTVSLMCMWAVCSDLMCHCMAHLIEEKGFFNIVTTRQHLLNNVADLLRNVLPLQALNLVKFVSSLMRVNVVATDKDKPVKDDTDLNPTQLDHEFKYDDDCGIECVSIELPLKNANPEKCDGSLEADISLSSEQVLHAENMVNLFTQAVQLCFVSVAQYQSSMSHVISNYQTCMKVLFLPFAEELPLILIMLKKYLFLAAEVEGQPALILQVSALDLISQIQDCVVSEIETRKKVLKSNPKTPKKTEDANVSPETGVLFVKEFEKCEKDTSIKGMDSRMFNTEMSTVVKAVTLVKDECVKNSLLKKVHKVKELMRQL